jgi:PAS domain S-box-containing protein
MPTPHDAASLRRAGFTPAAARLGLAAITIACAALAAPLAPEALRESLAWLGPADTLLAVGVAAAGLALLVLAGPAPSRPAWLVARAAACAAVAIGLAELTSTGARLVSAPGGLALALAGTSIALATRRAVTRLRAAEILGGAAASVGVLALLGHAYRVEDLYQLGAASMAPWTALSAGLLGFAGLVARPEFGLTRVLAGRSVGAAHLRRALPALTLIPLAAGLLAMGGVRFGLWDWGTAFAVFTLLSMSALGVVGALHAQHIDVLVRERRRLESLYRRIFENAAVGIAHLDAEGRWLRVNDRLCEILGWPREALLRGVPAGAPVLDRELLRAAAAATHAEQRFRTLEGGTVWVDLAVAPDRPDAGERWIAVVTDLTPRKRAEAELELAQRALASSSDAVVIAAAEPPEGRIVYVNAAFTRITGYAAEEALGQGWRFLAEGAEAPPEVGELCRLLQQGDSVSLLTKTRTKQGAEIWVEIRIAPLGDSSGGAVTHHLGLLQDVTEKLAAAAERERLLQEAVGARAEAERAGRAKDEFFALISHELRSPLGAITGWLAVLRRDAPPEVRSRAIEVLERNAGLLTRLIGDLLDASRIAGGKLEIERVPCDLLEVVKSAVTALEPTARERQLALALHADGEPAPVEGDPERLDQVVRNLVGNALKFTPPGGRIDVALQRAGESVHLEVRDDGQGISAAELPEVFERFRQGGGGVRGAQRGLGLGLSIVRHLVELHGGRVEVASDGSGLGTTFSVRLPAASRPLAFPASRPKRGADVLEGLCVLVLEPDRTTAEGLAMELEAADGEVAWVKTAVEALAQRDVLKPHVVVAEFDVGGEEAAELVRELRAGGPDESRLIAAIALSTAGTLASRRSARDAGFDGYLVRPFEPAHLVALIRSLVDRPRRVLVVDDDEASADSLALLLSRRGFEVECAYEAPAALAVAKRFRPDVVVTDLHLCGESGAALAASLRERGGRLRIVAATGRERHELGPDAALFDAYVRKPIELEVLLPLLGEAS